MKKALLAALLFCLSSEGFAWGFYAHQLINYRAALILPPEMMVLYKKNILFLSDHAVDPDKRRYIIMEEGARHFIDLDWYGVPPYNGLPRKWEDAVRQFSEDSLRAHGIVPWWIEGLQHRLTAAFRQKDAARILKLSAEIGHYISDAHVPLHACTNYNGQLTGQRGIHAFWESRVPELLAEKEWDLFCGQPLYLESPKEFIWRRVLESAAAADSVLKLEKKLDAEFPPDRKYAFGNRNGVMVKQYSEEYCRTYHAVLNHMIERRLRQSIQAVASCWYTAWVDAGQPRLGRLANRTFSEEEIRTFGELNLQWKNRPIKRKSCE